MQLDDTNDFQVQLTQVQLDDTNDFDAADRSAAFDSIVGIASKPYDD